MRIYVAIIIIISICTPFISFGQTEKWTAVKRALAAKNSSSNYNWRDTDAVLIYDSSAHTIMLNSNNIDYKFSITKKEIVNDGTSDNNRFIKRFIFTTTDEQGKLVPIQLDILKENNDGYNGILTFTYSSTIIVYLILLDQTNYI